MSALEKWMHHMGEPAQYHNVPYVRHDHHFVQCLLCGTGGMIHKQAKKHFFGSRHLAMFQKVKALKDQDDRRRQKEHFFRSLQARIASLGLPKWINEVKVFFLHDYVGDTVPEAIIKAQLATYEKMERLSLLELALWKYKICDSVAFSSMQEMREYKILEQDFDPAQFAREMRLVSGSPVIVPLVASFLW